MSTRRAHELAEAMLAIVATDGLEALSVRTLAERCRVSIGTVQYHFPTKEQMLVGAFERVVSRVEERARGVRLGSNPTDSLVRLLQELLPLDAERLAEARVVLAFTAAAATQPALAAIQIATLERTYAAVAEGVARVRRGATPTGADRKTARLLVAAVDGLAMHAVSAPGTLERFSLVAATRLLVRSLLGVDRAKYPAAIADEQFDRGPVERDSV